ncbi:TetR/AcrR family transcriptional regulator [Granulicella tundricola]|uniref:Regulatory protein TetR n=1 Tax=Granulicella tundricola (strain ATCC BAA-1859 / DSM 23138 / MP5ACTX9) TaxID=1198114 RepID=E8X314_GRATM|nr:TetR/AcrR family transcriptional regulator [Granulicella tundricola]ADW68148.1 regulatory protein TetR [Granulicella tundricola MP5ACTX9]
MPRTPDTIFEPRKSPVQARSAASVDAILQATIQVLLSLGKDRLTTTRVAQRAGVSVGTLYQYFPNKSSLLQAALRNHLEDVTSSVEQASLQQRGQPLAQQISALITAFLAAKMRHPKTSVALYAVSSDLDAAKIVRQIGDRSNKAIVAMLESSSDRLTSDPQLVALMLQGAMNGVSRRLLETPSPEKRIDALRAELIFFATSYLKACSTT